MKEGTPTSVQSPLRVRGRLEVFLAYAPGVGKTFRLVMEARSRQEADTPVVVGFIEPRGHPEILAALDGLEVIPRRPVEFRGLTVEEMDLAAILARRPRMAVIDEVAHTNVPGSPNRKRYQDIQALLESGIDVLCAFDVRHLESLNATIERIVQGKIADLVPDAFLRAADEIVALDLSSDALWERVRRGKVFPTPDVPPAWKSHFRPDALSSLRELMLREAAEHLDRRAPHPGESPGSGPGGGTRAAGLVQGNGGHLPSRVMVCVTSGSPRAPILLHRGSRLAGRLNTHWFVVYVETPSESGVSRAGGPPPVLGETLTRARELGAEVVKLVAGDPVVALLDFARSHGVSHIIVGRSQQPWWKQVLGWTPLSRLIWEAAGFDVHIVSFDQEENGP